MIGKNSNRGHLGMRGIARGGSHAGREAAHAPGCAPHRPGKRRQRESSEDRRTEIARVLKQLIVEKGFEGLRTRDIADRVGINIATLHYHVPGKQALMELVAESARAEFIAQAQAHPRDGMTPPQKLRREIEDYIDLLENNPQLLMLMSEISEKSRRDPEIGKAFHDMQNYWVGSIRQVFVDGVADGSFRADIDPDAAAALFVGALVGSAKMPVMKRVGYRALYAELERAFANTNPSPQDNK